MDYERRAIERRSVAAQVAIEHTGGTPERALVDVVSFSAGGMSFRFDHTMNVGARIIAHLRKLDGGVQTMGATVAWCDQSTIGVQFDVPLDLSKFVRGCAPRQRPRKSA